MRILKRSTATALLLMLLGASAVAAPVCTRGDVRALVNADRNLKASINRFENSKIKNSCSSGRSLLAEYHRLERVIKARTRCTLATSRDRRSWARLTSAMARAEREFHKGCR